MKMIKIVPVCFFWVNTISVQTGCSTAHDDMDSDDASSEEDWKGSGESFMTYNAYFTLSSSSPCTLLEFGTMLLLPFSSRIILKEMSDLGCCTDDS